MVHSILPADRERRLTLVFLHGMGGRMRDWSFLRMAFDLPWLEMVVLQGPIPHGKGWAWFELDERHRKTDRTFADIARSRGLLLEMLRSLDRDPASIVLGGFSQGCTIAIDTALREDVPLAGVLGISGYLPQIGDMPDGLGPLARPRRILVTHGRTDRTIPLEMAQNQYTALGGLGVPLEREVFDKGHTLDLDHEVPRIRRWLRSLAGSDSVED